MDIRVRLSNNNNIWGKNDKIKKFRTQLILR